MPTLHIGGRPVEQSRGTGRTEFRLINSDPRNYATLYVSPGSRHPGLGLAYLSLSTSSDGIAPDTTVSTWLDWHTISRLGIDLRTFGDFSRVGIRSSRNGGPITSNHIHPLLGSSVLVEATYDDLRGPIRLQLTDRDKTVDAFVDVDTAYQIAGAIGSAEDVGSLFRLGVEHNPLSLVGTIWVRPADDEDMGRRRNGRDHSSTVDVVVEVERVGQARSKTWALHTKRWCVHPGRSGEYAGEGRSNWPQLEELASKYTRLTLDLRETDWSVRSVPGDDGRSYPVAIADVARSALRGEQTWMAW